MSTPSSAPVRARRSTRVAGFALASTLALGPALALVPASAFAQGTAEQQEACTPDALKLCSATIPDIAKTTACMKAHVGDLSPRCRAAFASATTSAPTKTAKAPGRPVKAPSHLGERAAPRHAKTEPHVAARDGDRHLPREERTIVTRAQAAEPARRADAPPFPSPAAVAAIPIPEEAPEAGGSYRHSLANLCRNGLIDTFTCGTTIPAMGLGN